MWGQILQAMTESHTLVKYNSNEKLWWNLDKSDIINPEAETKGEFLGKMSAPPTGG